MFLGVLNVLANPIGVSTPSKGLDHYSSGVSYIAIYEIEDRVAELAILRRLVRVQRFPSASIVI